MFPSPINVILVDLSYAKKVDKSYLWVSWYDLVTEQT